MNHIMLDIETLDTKQSAVILSIGAIIFDPYNEASLEATDTNTFFCAIDSKDQRNRTTSDDTVAWWALQEQESILLNCYGTAKLPSVLTFFYSWIESVSEGNREIPIWCKGTDFDIAILRHAYEQYNLQLPWKYYQVRDLRTLMKATGTKPATTAKHDALDDAIQQAKTLSKIYTNWGLML